MSENRKGVATTTKVMTCKKMFRYEKKGVQVEIYEGIIHSSLGATEISSFEGLKPLLNYSFWGKQTSVKRPHKKSLLVQQKPVSQKSRISRIRHSTAPKINIKRCLM